MPRRRRCKRCRGYLGQREIGLTCTECRTGWIYFVEAVGAGVVKVGFCMNRRSLAHRIDTLSTASWCDLVVLGGRVGTMDDERDLHRRLSDWHVRGEWFQLNDDTLAILGFEDDGSGGHLVGTSDGLAVPAA